MTQRSSGLLVTSQTVCSWAKKRQMEFSVCKCKTVHYGKKNICHKYTMDGQPVKEVAKESKVAENCKEAYNKANRMLELISRMIK